MLSRRQLLAVAGNSYAVSRLAPVMSALAGFSSSDGALRCINVVNFIREIEPRFKMDMMLPVQHQMALVKEHALPATWLLQFDALVSGPFVPFLKSNIAADHEVGFWFEMNEKHCRAAGVAWRGRPGYEWDHLPPVAFSIGYTVDERIKLADTAMREFQGVWGHYPKSVASWNLDSVTIAHLVEHYGVDAFAVCRDQIATDGFTIWGAPIAGYYPSRNNCWSPALDRNNQIAAPIFRMLGQDPVYYYEKKFTLPDGGRFGSPDTMEPVWRSGQTPRFVDSFLEMIETAPSLRFAYAQLGQENTFPWDQQEPGYRPQMKALAELREHADVHVETMGESGRRFKRAFRQTPPQAQVQLVDPFGNSHPASASVWYQSRFYRGNLHAKGDLAYFRDLTVYSDTFKQPFLRTPTRDSFVEQRQPAVMDGYHWAGTEQVDGVHAGAFFMEGSDPLRLGRRPIVTERGSSLRVDLRFADRQVAHVRFEERALDIRFEGIASPYLAFVWDLTKGPDVHVASDLVRYRVRDFEYSVQIERGAAELTTRGWQVAPRDGGIRLALAQAR